MNRNKGCKQIPFKTKAADDDGYFVGYAAVFNNVDDGGYMILPGAFKEFLVDDDNQILVALHHDLRQTIAKATFEQDDKGLKVEGRVITDLYEGQQAYIRMKNNLLTAMSIGYEILENGYEYIQEEGIFLLKRLKLIEASFVTVGMNPLAGIVDLKQASTVREFEKVLRDAGLSKTEATAVASHGFKGLARRDAGTNPNYSGMLRGLIAEINQQL